VLGLWVTVRVRSGL